MFGRWWQLLPLLLLCCFAACENSAADIAALSDDRMMKEEAKNVESFLSQGGVMKARLTAPVMNRLQPSKRPDSAYIEFPNSLHVDFYNDSLVIESQLNALYGRYKDNEQKVFLRDSVIVYNLKKDTLRCEELWWDQRKEIFYTDKPVQIHQPDKIIYGKGLEADQSFNWYVIKEITGPILVPKGGFGPSAAVGDSTSPRTDSLPPDR